jgi:hypothetical protein
LSFRKIDARGQLLRRFEAIFTHGAMILPVNSTEQTIPDSSATTSMKRNREFAPHTET